MHVQPELLDHPKLAALEVAVGEEYALKAVLRLWAHCQMNARGGTWKVKDTPRYVEMVCRWTGTRGKLYRALVQTGFIDMPAGRHKAVVIHDWEKTNWKLVSAWNNGKLGGRPPQKPKSKSGFHDQKPKSKSGFHDQKPKSKSGKPIISHLILSHSKVLKDPQSSGGPGEMTGVGANAQDSTKKSSRWPSQEQCVAVAEGLGIRREWAQEWWLEHEGRGWRDRHGQPVRRWEAAMRACAVSGGVLGGSGATVWELQKQLEALEGLRADHKGNPENNFGDAVRESNAASFKVLESQIREMRERIAGVKK